jgi:ABC-type phosphate transport system substrate-binding protein
MSIKSIRSAGAILLIFVVWACPGLGQGTSAAADLVIIANPGVAETALDTRDLQRIYLGKQTQWQDDSSIVPVMLKSGPLNDQFIENYIDRSVQRFVTYWRQMVFTGKGIPPKSFVQESDLVEYVASTPGSVGFASADTKVSGVKVLSLD